MAADPPNENARVIIAYLDDVDLELDAAKRLIAEPVTGPSSDEVIVWIKTIAGLCTEARALVDRAT